MNKFLEISKLDAAKRQLETFVRLYFSNGDPVAMHTLVAAAYGVVRDLNRKRGGKPTLQEQMFERAKPEYKQMLLDKLLGAQNFFKHADRDHAATIRFNPDSTELLAMDACSKYAELTGEQPALFQIYTGWMMISYREIFELAPHHAKALNEAAPDFLSSGRAAYFADMLPVVMKTGV